MRFDPEMSWGANAGLGIARNAVSVSLVYALCRYAIFMTRFIACTQ
jgi:hypothetical protein